MESNPTLDEARKQLAIQYAALLANYGSDKEIVQSLLTAIVEILKKEHNDA